MKSFINGMEVLSNTTLTANGDKAYKSTGNKCLDLFSSGGSTRNWSDQEKVNLFLEAVNESPEDAIRLLFYLRDIRGGQGEREFFRLALNALAQVDFERLTLVFPLVPEYGRWDDLYALVGIRDDLDQVVFSIMKDQLLKDIKSEHPSLLAKWLKSENTSSLVSRALAKKTREFLGVSPRVYRKTLSTLRARLNIVETLISQGKYSKIEYSKVPSRALNQYRAAFYRNDQARFSEWIADVSSGVSKVNSKDLYPHEIIRSMIGWNISKSQIELAKNQWNALPDYLDGNDADALIVADVSGSMAGTPLEVCFATTMYFAHRTKGAFANKAITFHFSPSWISLTGELEKDVKILGNADWGGNTNLGAVFDLILKVAVDNNLSEDEIPSKLIVISDMQFDRCVNISESTYERAKKNFSAAGYTIPHVVFWNVNATPSNQPTHKNEFGTSIISGWSPASFKYIMNGEITTPMDLMNEVLNSPRYSNILRD